MTETTKSGFHTTNWTLVQPAAVDPIVPTADSRRTLSTLCQMYRHPIYAFIRRNGYDPVHRIRRKHRRLLRMEITGTVSTLGEIDGEIRFLVSARST